MFDVTVVFFADTIETLIPAAHDAAQRPLQCTLRVLQSVPHANQFRKAVFERRPLSASPSATPPPPPEQHSQFWIAGHVNLFRTGSLVLASLGSQLSAPAL